MGAIATERGESAVFAMRPDIFGLGEWGSRRGQCTELKGLVHTGVKQEMCRNDTSASSLVYHQVQVPDAGQHLCYPVSRPSIHTSNSRSFLPLFLLLLPHKAKNNRCLIRAECERPSGAIHKCTDGWGGRPHGRKDGEMGYTYIHTISLAWNIPAS